MTDQPKRPSNEMRQKAGDRRSSEDSFRVARGDPGPVFSMCWHTIDRRDSGNPDWKHNRTLTGAKGPAWCRGNELQFTEPFEGRSDHEDDAVTTSPIDMALMSGNHEEALAQLRKMLGLTPRQLVVIEMLFGVGRFSQRGPMSQRQIAHNMKLRNASAVCMVLKRILARARKLLAPHAGSSKQHPMIEVIEERIRSRTAHRDYRHEK